MSKTIDLNKEFPYDFYNDPNIAEAVSIKPVLLKYENALKIALSNWPEHAVLLNLQTICKKVMSFSVTSPIMKLLLGLELLLVKSDDWEAYTSKQFSLKEPISDIVKLIVKWRKFELETWKDLLAIEDRKCEEKIGSQWFHLWKIINGALSTKMQQEKVSIFN
jgi:midasin